MAPSTNTLIKGPFLSKGAVCERILRALPDWFGIETAIVQYVKDINAMPTLIAEVDEKPVGFLTIKIHFPHSAEIHVVGILPEHHRRGIGKNLLSKGENWLLKQGFEFLQVKTLSSTSKDKNYAKTRMFYEAMGFKPLQEFSTLWDDHNPCLLMIKTLGLKCL